MLWFKKKNIKNMDNINSSDIINSQENELIKTAPRYEYDVKIYEEGEDPKQPITSIQSGIKANSETELREWYRMSGINCIEILNRREINPPKNELNQIKNKPIIQNSQINDITNNPIQQVDIKPKYFSRGGLDFKIVGNDVYQKQWIIATEEECKKIRIVSDSNNKIFELNGKHIEIQHWVKVDFND
jgi:hypothetical protein